MLISIVVVFYNQGRYINRALRSVIQQTYAGLDIIVVDDGSDEDIGLEVRRFKDPRIRFFRKENGGPASARNFGIKEVRGQYIAFLDGDDVFLPDKIEAMFNLLEQRGFPICVTACGAYVVDEKQQFVGRVVPQSYQKGDLINTALVRPSCCIYHADVFSKCGGFPEALRSNEDGALNTVIAQKFPIICTPKPLVLYQMDASGLARRDLNDFSSAVSVMQGRLDFVSPHLDPDKTLEYKQRSIINLLFGFLSSSNMVAAKTWMPKVDRSRLLRSLPGILAWISVISRVNIYLFSRRIRRVLSRLCLLPVQGHLREYL